MKAPRNRLARAVLTLVGVVYTKKTEPPPRRRRRAEPPASTERETGPNRLAENWVLVTLLLGTAGAAGFMVFYVVFPDTQLLGLTLGAGLVFLGVAAALAGKAVVPQEKVIEEYHDFGEPEKQEDVEEIVEEAGDGISRRRLMLGAAGTAGAALGGAALFPAASLGPNVSETIYRTPWHRGRLIVGVDDEPILADRVEIGTFVTGFPEAAEKAKIGSPLIIVRVPPEDLDLPEGREGSAPEGIIAYSKVCPHAGCAVSMYRHPLYDPTAPSPALVCPCHYSTFDPSRGGHLEFGPAGRDLPQLPIRINDHRELEAAGDFFDPPGPSYGGIRLADPSDT